MATQRTIKYWKGDRLLTKVVIEPDADEAKKASAKKELVNEEPVSEEPKSKKALKKETK